MFSDSKEQFMKVSEIHQSNNWKEEIENEIILKNIV